MSNGFYTTAYDYDTFGNLVWVKDPAQGITTMKYDTLNRLKERNLPNGMKTEWGYDSLDRIETVTHKNAQGTVISSVTYERKASGEPIKITREDGTYTKLQYDNALRVTNEQFYNAQNALLDERTYVYDNDGKRIATLSSIGDRTYNYTAGYQLDSITSTTGNEDYDYDVNGRMDVMQRDGETLDLDHDVYDRMTSVKNLTSGTTTNYVYDGEGRRVKSTTAGNERYFLVTPASGSGLESTDLMYDQSGNITANYVYAGGYSPFMKLDANGNPVYYLTDGMGSVIGMADQSGQSVAKYSYDSFGNIRNRSGSLADTTGGDFRFQGQWLESATGIYHFRARDYDSRTGTFLSRDPVDPNEQQPESMNSYQAMYNNPYIYSDPSGKVTLSDLNMSQVIQDILNTIQQQSRVQSSKKLMGQAQSVATDVFTSALQTLAPTSFNYPDILQVPGAGKQSAESTQGGLFENVLEGLICQVLGSATTAYAQFLDYMHYEAGIAANGTPVSNGRFKCDSSGNIQGPLTGKPNTRYYPDFIIKSGDVAGDNSRRPPAFLIGDFKRDVKSIDVKENQFKAIMKYSRSVLSVPSPKAMAPGYQYAPVALYVTLIGGNRQRMERNRIVEALTYGVVLKIISLRP